ncbi:MAG: FxLYD domain-containing protein [Erysipelotrichaceae bacterium]|nr:FxLYD domain-containing protein [Erysipelotrichaceae bacterium]
MKKCKYCQTEIDKKAKICPNCRKKQGANGCLIAIIVIVVLAIIGAAFGSDSNSNNNSNSNTDTSTTNKEKFSYEITSEYADDYSFAHYIEGIVTNNTDKDYSYVQIEFICYDKDGTNLGTAIDNTNNLLGNQTWKFKAMAMFSDVENVDHCDYHEVTGY